MAVNPSALKVTLLAVAVAALITTAVTQLLYATKPNTLSGTAAPLPVAVTPFIKQSAYTRLGRFIGVVSAEHDSLVAFEVAGSVNSLPATNGLRVIRGDRLATLDTDRKTAALATAEAEIRRVKADLNLAQLQQQRVTDLLIKGLVSQQAVDEANYTVDALQATLDRARSTATEAGLDIEKSTLTAPFAGVVAKRLVEVGAVVNAGTPVLQLISDGKLEARIGVPQQIAATLSIGDTYTITADNRSFTGRLRAIRQDIDPVTLTVGAIFDLPEALALLDGQSVTLELEESVPMEGGWLPLDALTEGDRGLWNVLVVNAEIEGHIARRETVEVIYSRGDQVFVRGTLAEQALVISGGLQRLSSGRIVEPLGL